MTTTRSRPLSRSAAFAPMLLLSLLLPVVIAACVTPGRGAAERSTGAPRGSFQEYEGPGSIRLRGAMCGDFYVPRNFGDLRRLGANVVRWHVNHPFGWAHLDGVDPEADRAEWFAWLEHGLDDTELAIQACERLGMYMIIDLPGTPGNRNENGVPNLIFNEDFREIFYDTWELMAEQFRGRTPVIAFELTNEPYVTWEMEFRDWDEIFLAAAARIRAVDPGRTLVYEPPEYAGSQAFLYLEPLPIDNVIYSVHMYSPLAFTHQFQTGVPTVYPGTAEVSDWEREAMGLSSDSTPREIYWDKSALAAALAPVRRFQEHFDVPIWVGEFSAVRWAPDNSAYRYIRDCIELFEEYGWDWTYHTYRSSHFWSVEHTTDEWNYEPAEGTTDRERLLAEAFSLNEHPR
jgi:endoglucanase